MFNDRLQENFLKIKCFEYFLKFLHFQYLRKKYNPFKGPGLSQNLAHWTEKQWFDDYHICKNNILEEIYREHSVTGS